MSKTSSDSPQLSPRITVIGVGGAGGNAVNNMVREKLSGVEFLIANTDAQALSNSDCENRLQLGNTITRGLGAGSKAEIGQAAAEEQIDEILNALDNSHMVFITAGMGGGTGTGAAPVIARVAREQGMLTVGVVTKPFHFEGQQRMAVAEEGIKELQKYVDTLIVIPNQNLFRVANEQTTFATAFKMADDVLMAGVRGVTDLMVMPGLINLDFADIRSIMTEMGKAMMGTGEATGEGRSIKAAEAAISNPLLDDISMKGAQGVLINITGGPDMTLFEVDETANRIREEVDPAANIIFGSTYNDKLEGIMRVSVVATGIEQSALAEQRTTASRKQNISASPEDNLDLFGNLEENPNTTKIENTFTSTEHPQQQMPDHDTVGHPDADGNTPRHFIPQEAVVPQQQAPVLNRPFSEDFNTAPVQAPPKGSQEKPSFLKRFFSGKKTQDEAKFDQTQGNFSNPYSNQSVQFSSPSPFSQETAQDTQGFFQSHAETPSLEKKPAQAPQPEHPASSVQQDQTAQQAQRSDQIANDNLAIPAFLRRQRKG